MNVELDGYPFKIYKVNGSKKVSYRPVKLFLIEKYGVCFHCGKQVKDYGEVYRTYTPPDMATIDHLIPRQFRKRYQRVEKVLACHECNKRRNTITQRNNP